MSHTRPPRASIRPAQPLSGSGCAPGDKRIGRQALVLAGLAIGESGITGLPDSDGMQHLATAMRALGAEVLQAGPGAWRVAGRGVGGVREPHDIVDVGGCMTAARLLCGILASHDLFAVLTGDSSLRRQPMRRMTELLQLCGAQFQGPANGGLPLAIRGARDALPIDCRLPLASESIKPGLLLAGLNAPGCTRIEEPEPTCDHTARILRHFGAQVLTEPSAAGHVTRLMGQPELRAADVAVPGDPSLAAFPLVAALIVPGSVVTICGVGLNPLRTGLFATLRAMGARLGISHERLEAGEPVGDVTATYTGLRGAETPAARTVDMIDDLPILAVAAACATGPTRLHGHTELRAETSARLSIIAAMLNGNGVRTTTECNDLVVHGAGPVPPGGGRIDTPACPSLDMSALILGLATAAPVEVRDPTAIENSFPGFAALMRSLGATIT